MIRATFSAETNTIEARLPKSWAECGSEELKTLYDLTWDEPSVGSAMSALKYLLQLKQDRNYTPLKDEYRYIMTVIEDGVGKKKAVLITAEMFAEWIEELSWMYQPSDTPVRIDRIDGAKAKDAKFHGVDFMTYYMVENYWQGYLQSKNTKALQMIEKMLYPGITPEDEMSRWRQANIINWIAPLRNMFAHQFKNYFRPCQGVSKEKMLDVMNNQIRILTGGDVTKEEQVNKTDCWRALTELDFKAVEAEEIRRQQNKIK